ncbi:FecR family protein [Planctomicrobium sp. SH661]|uniref:FecR family protein n=1 Tax=Planctomicrobium sp. SH661 TaxID=3448124 RepID=UPI003F5C6FDD
MSGEQRSNIDEVRQLADAVFDRHVSAHTMQRIESLITGDLGCLQAYVERIGFHADLMNQSVERSSARQAEFAMDRILVSQAHAEGRRRWLNMSLMATGLLLAVGFGAWIAISPAKLSPQVGTVAHLTSDARLDAAASIELGQIVRENEWYTVNHGIVSLELPHVAVDLIAPVTIRLQANQTLELKRGSVHVLVAPGGEGFTVATPNSQVIDYGTEFSVEYQPAKGTEVHVLQGKVQASLLSPLGNVLRVLDLTAKRSAQIPERQPQIREINFASGTFERVEKARGKIQKIDGALRTVAELPPSLQGQAVTTTNHMLVVPERQHVIIEKEISVEGLSGPVRIPAGTSVSSYLVHYDPDEWTTFAPRGAVTFDSPIAAVLVGAESLNSTDSLFGLAATAYETEAFRELELDEDEVRLSDDRKTVSFYFGVSGEKSLDQARILLFR